MRELSFNEAPKAIRFRSIRQPSKQMTEIVIFTDIDGTLIDFETYSTDVTNPLIRRLSERQVPVIFCSSKTLTEQRAIQKAYAIEMPCIVENGSAIFAPSGFWKSLPESASTSHGGWSCIELGMRTGEIKKRLRRVESHIGESLIGFGDMPTEDVARLTCLDLISARNAQIREYSETLALHRPDAFWEALDPVFESHGLKCLSGGRFHTVTGLDCDKGKAIRAFMEAYARDTGRTAMTLGLGDSPNDMSLLEAVDRPFQVQRPTGDWAKIEVPRLERIDRIGPVGWVKAVEEALAESG